jgi:hypothetical protein
MAIKNLHIIISELYSDMASAPLPFSSSSVVVLPARRRMPRLSRENAAIIVF